MTLEEHANHPSHRAYVVKLDRDALVPPHELAGRVEHIVSGAQCEFANGDELVAWLTRHVVAEDCQGEPMS
jgi:D-arabinose 1-dehydrogenase-like Zn-dependent alcohol dehydrogenase